MFIYKKDHAVAAAAGLTAGLWYTLANLVIFSTLKGWLPQAVLMYAPQIAIIVQYVSFHGIAQDGSFAFLYFLAGLLQIVVAAAILFFVATKVYRLVRKN